MATEPAKKRRRAQASEGLAERSVESTTSHHREAMNTLGGLEAALHAPTPELLLVKGLAQLLEKYRLDSDRAYTAKLRLWQDLQGVIDLAAQRRAQPLPPRQPKRVSVDTEDDV